MAQNFLWAITIIMLYKNNENQLAQCTTIFSIYTFLFVIIETNYYNDLHNIFFVYIDSTDSVIVRGPLNSHEKPLIWMDFSMNGLSRKILYPLCWEYPPCPPGFLVNFIIIPPWNFPLFCMNPYGDPPFSLKFWLTPLNSNYFHFTPLEKRVWLRQRSDPDCSNSEHCLNPFETPKISWNQI